MNNRFSLTDQVKNGETTTWNERREARKMERRAVNQSM